jgi:hypothetical protein
MLQRLGAAATAANVMLLLPPLIMLLLPCVAAAVADLQELSEKLIVVVGQDDLSKEAQRNATTTFMTNLRANLASKRVLGEYM